MIIPIEVVYTKSKKDRMRNVICAIYPTVLAQVINFNRIEPIVFDAGDIKVDWEALSPGCKYYIESHEGNYV